MSLMFDGVYCTPLPVAFEFLSLVHTYSGRTRWVDRPISVGKHCLYLLSSSRSLTFRRRNRREERGWKSLSKARDLSITASGGLSDIPTRNRTTLFQRQSQREACKIFPISVTTISPYLTSLLHSPTPTYPSTSIRNTHALNSPRHDLPRLPTLQ